MNVTQIRNATIILSFDGHHILVDPMLSKRGRLPRLRYFKKTMRNPQVELPNEFQVYSSIIDFALITHCQKGHFDHLDNKGIAFLKERNVPVFSHVKDNAYLEKLGLTTMPLIKGHRNQFFDGTIELVNARHGTGPIAAFMEHGVGYFIQLPETPSLYIMGDTILTEEIKQFIQNKKPEYIVAPMGMAKFDLGSPILLTEKEIIELARLSQGKIIANHMDALDHCRITRVRLGEMVAEHAIQNILIPRDGETVKLLPGTVST
jgi:L-ascorbate metabolism protein UlaG (beta-lactamase superfamily)